MEKRMGNMTEEERERQILMYGPSGTEPTREEIDQYMKEHDTNFYNAREALRERAYGGKPPRGFVSWGEFWKNF
jgi:hypothetical protein